MQFRARGNLVRLVRSGYDAEAKKPTSEIIAKLVRPDLELSDADRAKLTPEEIEEVEAFRNNASSATNIERDYAVHRLPEVLRLATEWLATAPKDRAATLAADIQKPLKKFRRDLEIARGGSEDGEKPAKGPKAPKPDSDDD